MTENSPQEMALRCPLPLADQATIQMAHGGGGRWMRMLIEGMFRPAFAAEAGPAFVDASPAGASSPPAPAHDSAVPSVVRRPSSVVPMAPAHDSAVLQPPPGRLAFTTDTFVVRPLFFPGGDIGTLAVYGTANDLAMAGARPLWLSAGFVLEEGLPMDTLARVVQSMRQAAAAAGVRIVTGDTKVVDRGKGDGIYINTSGIGVVPPGIDISPARVVPGDVVLVSGDLGRHGMAVMSVREGLGFEADLQSDCAPLAGLVEAMLAAGADLHCLRDLTRGGLASALNEIAADARVGITLDESAIAVSAPVAAACEILGLDPLYVANEGRLVAFVAPAAADAVLEVMRRHGASCGPARIGRVSERYPGTVEIRGLLGGARILDFLSGEQMPRIC
ncbi:MAG: hydrogenase expression/formation protein HypE [Thermoguttaceae bacterium]|jgi:hydrogenase expression/formation protein HypE